MGVLDKLVLVYETQGADKASSELKKAEANADATAKAYDDLALKSNELKQQILDLSMEVKTASDRDKKSLNSSLVAKVNQLNVSKDELSFAKKKAQIADSQFKILSKRQKEGDKAAGQFADKNKKLLGSFLALGAKVGLVTAPIIAFKKVLEGTLAFERTAQNLRLLGIYSGESSLDVQTLGNALKSYGGDAASASAVVGNLNSNIQKMRMEQGGALQGAALLYGLDLSGTGADGLVTADELLKNISKRMETLNTQQQLDLGKMIGLDAPTIAMLQAATTTLGRLEAILEKGKTRSIFTQDDLDRAKEFNEVSLDWKANWGKLSAVLNRRIGVPILEGLLEATDPMRRHHPTPNPLWKKSRGTEDAIKAGGKALGSTKTPLSSAPASSAFYGGSGGNSPPTSVSILELNINTAATDAEGIAQDIEKAVTNSLKSIVNQNYSGEK